MSATKPPAVAAAFSNSCRPASWGDNLAAAIPDPTTTATKNAVPLNSASARRASGCVTSATGSLLSRRSEAVAVLQHGVDLPRAVGPVNPDLVLLGEATRAR